MSYTDLAEPVAVSCGWSGWCASGQGQGAVHQAREVLGGVLRSAEELGGVTRSAKECFRVLRCTEEY